MSSYSLANALTVDSAFAIDPALLGVLDRAFVVAQKRLSIFAKDPEFSEKMILTFGKNADLSGLQSEWQSGQFDLKTSLQVRSASELNGAFGAFSAQTNTIYLSYDFLRQSSADRIAQVLLEEYGHSVDSRTNVSDTQGDEGELFSALVGGQTLSAARLATIKSEDDSSTITLDGSPISVENAILQPGFMESIYFSGLPSSSTGLTIDPLTRTIFVADRDISGILRKIDPNRVLSTVTNDFTPASGFYPYIATDIQFANGFVYSALSNGELVQVSASTGAAQILTQLPGFSYEAGLDIRNNKIYITDGDGSSNQLWEFDLTTSISNPKISGLPPSAYGFEFDPTQNKFYFAALGTNFYQADPQTGTYQLLSTAPSGVGNFAIDPTGNFLYARVGPNIMRISTLDGSSITFQSGLSGDNSGDLAFGPSSSGSGSSLYVVNGNSIVEISGFPSLPPQVTAPTSFTVTEDVAGNLAFAGTPFADVDSSNLTVTLSIPDGTVAGIAGTGITIGGTATARTFSGTTAALNTYFTTAGKITYTTALNNNAARTLTVNVNDGALNSVTTSTVNITPVNDAPTVTTVIPDITATENSVFNYNFTIPAGTFADIDSGDSLTYTTTLVDGAGNAISTPSWLTFTSNNGTWNFSGTPRAGDVGTLKVKVTATDNFAASVSDTFDLVINALSFTGNLTTANNLTGTASGNTMTGGNINDIISGGAGNDTLNGLDGNDRLNGGNDNDTLNGGIGNDTLYGDAGDDTLNGDAGNDNLYGGIGNDVLNGGIGNDILNGDAGNDTLNGGDGKDNLKGGAGDDTLAGGAGDDTLAGGIGDDTFTINVDTAQGKDLINGDAGIDTLDFSGSTAAVKVNLFKPGSQMVSPNLVLTVLTLENVKGGSGADTLFGNSANNILTGGAGADKFGFGGSGILTLAALGVDKISDFTVADDKIQLSKSTFSMLATIGTLATDKFTQIASVNDTDAMVAAGSIVYNSTTGNLFYNSNGATAGIGANGGQFAQLNTGLTLTNSMFEVIA